MTPVNEDMSIKQVRDLAATFDFFISCSTNRTVFLLRVLSKLAESMDQDYQVDEDEDSGKE